MQIADGLDALELRHPPARQANIDRLPAGAHGERPHSGLDYRTPLEVHQTWEDLQREQANSLAS
jgi:hypothetical protein